MSTHVIDAEEVIDNYRAAVEHANGRLFASELKVSHADGWFTVRDLDGTESRYRQKEIVSLTRELLKQPDYKPENFADLVEEVAATRPPAPPAPVRPPKTQPVEVAHASESSFGNQQINVDVQSEVRISSAHSVSSSDSRAHVPEPTSEKVVAFPGSAGAPVPASASTRDPEERSYKRNLWRIFLIVGAAFGALIIFLLVRGR